MLRRLINNRFKDIIKDLWRISIVNNYYKRGIHCWREMLKSI